MSVGPFLPFALLPPAPPLIAILPPVPLIVGAMRSSYQPY